MTRWDDVRSVLDLTIDHQLAPKEIAAQQGWSMRKVRRVQEDAKRMLGASLWSVATARWAEYRVTERPRPRRRTVDPTEPMGLA